MSSTLIAVKEKENRLIMDGPTEIVNNKLMQFKKENDKSRKEYAQTFFTAFTKDFGISKEQFTDLVNSIKDEDIPYLQQSLVAERKRNIKRGLFILAVIAPITVLLYFGAWTAPFIGLRIISGMLGFLGTFCTLILVGDAVISIQRVRDITYLKYLRKEFGSNFFPIQELKQELGLIDKTHN